MAEETLAGKALAGKKILWLFAIGQLGWSMLSGIISNWLVYFYQPGESLLAQGHQLFITQGAVFLGLTVIGLITASGRIFDAITDPLIASLSDRCKHRWGRRIPFLRFAPIPFGLFTILIFWSPFEGVQLGNNLFLLGAVLCFYVSMTCYCTPYNALIPELGRTQNQRINVSTFLSVTYFFGTAFAYLVPTIAGIFEPSMGSVGSFRATIAILACFAVVFMLVPAFTIDEHKYAVTTPSETPTFSSLGKTFKNKQFQTFVCSDILYWIALTMFQTGLPFYITELMGLDDSMTFPLFALMTLVSFCCYPIVNVVAKRIGKKRLVVFAFLFFCLAFGTTSCVGCRYPDGDSGHPAAGRGCRHRRGRRDYDGREARGHVLRGAHVRVQAGAVGVDADVYLDFADWYRRHGVSPDGAGRVCVLPARRACVHALSRA